MPDMPNIPPQILAALQQQQQAGASAPDIGDMLQQLMQMSPDEVATVLQQMGIQVTPEQVQSAAENWVDQAADSASGSNPDDETAEPTPDNEPAEGEAAPTANNLETAEANAGEQPTDESDEGEDGGALPPNAQPTAQQGAGASSGEGEVDPRMAAMLAAQGGGGAMPRGPAGIPTGGPMDDLISAQMMQRAVGNPNATVPQGPGVGGSGGVPMPRSANAIPTPRAGGGANNPRMAAMIADIYRSTGGKTGRQRQPSAAPGKTKNLAR